MGHWTKTTKLILASAVGCCIVGGLTFLWVCSRVPKAPDPQTASTGQIIDFFSSSGIDSMSNEKKFQYLNAFVERNRGAEQQQAVSLALAKLSDGQLDQIKKNSVEAVGWTMLQRSEEFNHAGSDRDKERIAMQVMQEVETYNSFARSLIHLAPNVQKTAPKDSNDAINIIMKYIPPANIAKMEPLILKCMELRLKNRKVRK